MGKPGPKKKPVNERPKRKNLNLPPDVWDILRDQQNESRFVSEAVREKSVREKRKQLKK